MVSHDEASPSSLWSLIKAQFFGLLKENRTMVAVLKIFKQHIFYVANSIFGIIPYNHSLNSTFDACPEVFFVEGLKKKKKEDRQTMARLRFL